MEKLKLGCNIHESAAVRPARGDMMKHNSIHPLSKNILREFEDRTIIWGIYPGSPTGQPTAALSFRSPH